MGSLIVKIDNKTEQKLKNIHHYSDIDMLTYRNPKYNDVPISYDVDAVRISLRNILTWRVGESILRPEFGHNLKKSMYEQLNEFNQDRVGQEIKRAIEMNEPRVNVKSVSVRRPDDDEDGNALQVNVMYIVKAEDGQDIELSEQTKILGK